MRNRTKKKLGNKVYLAGRIENPNQQSKKGFRWGFVNTSFPGNQQLDNPELGKTRHTPFEACGTTLIYTGPYTLRDDHCGSHTPFSVKIFDNNFIPDGYGSRSHGSGLDITQYIETKEADLNATFTFNRSMDGIKKADVVFVWIDSMEAHGTLVEIGYARAFEKHIVLAVPELTKLTADDPANNRGELWFSFQAANEVVRGNSAEECFEVWVENNYSTQPKGINQ